MEYLRNIQQFFKEVMAELRKVNWPNRGAITNSTTVVLVVTVILAFFLGAVDIGLARVVEFILR
jgi:preprotein translocase subunit SecE